MLVTNMIVSTSGELTSPYEADMKVDPRSATATQMLNVAVLSVA
jgi:hypothetical protein